MQQHKDDSIGNAAPKTTELTKAERTVLVDSFFSLQRALVGANAQLDLAKEQMAKSKEFHPGMRRSIPDPKLDIKIETLKIKIAELTRQIGLVRQKTGPIR